MARILAISSQVARGRVGLNAIVPALQSLGHEAITLPTVVLSNHPAHRHSAGQAIEPEVLGHMLDALEANGWLAGIDAVLTGYLPSAAHVAFAAAAVKRIRAVNKSGRFFCDPILGDDPMGLYIDAAAALAIRDSLIPLADVALPNRFELAWLTGHTIGDVATAIDAARSLPAAAILTSSIPAPGDRLATIFVERDAAWFSAVPKLAGVPHGTGDLLSGLFAAHMLAGQDGVGCLGLSAAGVAAVVSASLGHDELDLMTVLHQLTSLDPLPVERVETERGSDFEETARRARIHPS